MRIVYDDAMQSEMVEAIETFMDTLDVELFVSYEWGTDRVQMHKLRESLNRFLSSRHINIGNTVTHAHSIGNNCLYPVYFQPADTSELQQCGNINLNTGLYGEGYVSCEDYNGRRVGPCYKVQARWGVSKSE